MRISIGLPFFNNAATLAEALRSVFAQTFDDWELILIDDGSHDGSLEIARSVADGRVRVVSDGKNRGIASRLNQITQLARAEYIAHIHGDDLMHPTRLQRQLEHLDGDPGLQIVSTGMFAIDAASRPVGKRGCDPMPLSADGLLRGRGLAHPTITGRASWFRANPYDPEFRRAEDYELWCRSFAKDHLRAELIPEPLYFYREEGSVTLAKMLGSYREMRTVLRRDGPAMVGWGRSRLIIGTLRAKEVAYRLAAMIGKEMMIVRRRNQPLSDNEWLSASQTLQSILNTAVPGIPDFDARAHAPVTVEGDALQASSMR